MAIARVKGREFDIPEGLTDRDETAAYLMAQYGFSPQDLGAENESQFARLGPAARFTQAGLVSLGERLSHLVPGTNIGDAGIDQLRRQDPIGTAFGDAAPIAAAPILGPGIAGAAAGAAGIAGGIEAFQPGSTPLSTTVQAVLAAGGEFGGAAGGQISGRVVNAVTEGARGLANAVRRTRLGRQALNVMESGIQQTMGRLTGNRQLQQAEASLARNPVTAGPFVAMDEANEAVARTELLDYVGNPGADTLQEGLADAHLTAIHNMDNAIDPAMEIVVPRPLVNRLRRLEDAAPAEFEVPGGTGQRPIVLDPDAPIVDEVVVTGADLRSVISDLRKGAVSPTGAVVRRNAREALADIDEVLAESGADLELWRTGSRQYRRWIQATNGRAVSRLDPERINPTTVLNNLKKGNKAAVQSRGNISSGSESTDRLIQVMEDFQQVGQIAPDSGTATGVAIPLVAADIVTTGGQGTAGAFLGSRASQTEAGTRALAGIINPAPVAGRVGGGLGGVLGGAVAGQVTDQEIE